MSEPRCSRRGEGYGACDDERRESRLIGAIRASLMWVSRSFALQTLHRTLCKPHTFERTSDTVP